MLQCASTRLRLLSIALIASTGPLGCGSKFDESKILQVAARVFASPETGSDGAAGEPEGRQAGPGEVDARESGVIIESSDISTVPERSSEVESRAYYRYTDASGRIHLVEGIQNVPAPYRAKASNLSGTSNRALNLYDAAAVTRRVAPRVATSTFNANRLDVSLYSATWCGACRRVKRLLDEEDVSYTEIDIDVHEDARDRVRAILGSVKIPLLDIDGTYIAGYHRDAILRKVKGG